MSLCILDASFSFQWLFEDEASAEGDAALAAIRLSGAIIPPLWFAEIANGLGMAERRGRISPTEMVEGLDLLRSLPQIVAEVPDLAWCASILETMRAYRLTAYDATYLELARRHGLPLATRDRDLLAAAPAVGVGVFAVVP